MLKNILYLTLSIVIFITGVIVYGIILNIREVTLAEAMQKLNLKKLDNVHLVVNRKKYLLVLYSDTIEVKSYKAAFGKSNYKKLGGINENVTPTGKYKICKIDTNSKYHKFLKLNYPNKINLSEALKQNYISKNRYDKIIYNINKYGYLPDDSDLAPNIGIQGIGKYNIIFKNLPFSFNWTNGSIAVSDESIDEIYSVVSIGTKVEIIY